MKRIISLMMCLCMSLGIFAGCAAKTEEIPVETEAMMAPSEAVEEFVEWELNTEEVGCAMPAEVTDAFIAATNNESFKFVPVAYVASKETEDGMIYRILCQSFENALSVAEDIPVSVEEDILDAGVDAEEASTEIESESIVSKLAMLDILIDANAEAKINMVEDFNLNEEMRKTEEEKNNEAILSMADGWVKNLEQSVSAMNGDVLMAFDNAVAENDNFFEALSSLGYQETADGVNYAILCRQTSTDEVPVTEMAIMFISITSESVEIINVVTM